MSAYLIITVSVLFLASCGKNQVKDGGADKPSPEPSAKLTSNGNGERYENEGFITANTYRIMIVAINDGSIDEKEYDKQIRNKAVASLKKYISSRNKSLTANTNAQILNLIADYGSVKQVIIDGKKLFVLDIDRQGLRDYVEGFGQ
jgi:hypothetical protein